jgi:hypothetical protein
LREVSIDKSQLELTYSEWLQIAEDKLIGLRLEGLNVVPVNVDVDALLKWCRENKFPINGESRVKYAMELARHMNAQNDRAT